MSNKTELEKIKLVKNFVKPTQLLSAFEMNDLDKIYSLIEKTPLVFEQEELECVDRKFYLHYFTPSSDFYIAEKDTSDIQHQAYGFVCLNGDSECAEYGYISIDEIIKHGAELDFYFNPTSQNDIVNEIKNRGRF